MKKMSVAAAKAHFSELLSRVESGQDVLITRRGAPVARLSGVERAKRPLDLGSIDAFRSGLPSSKTRAADLIRGMRDERF